MSIFYVDGEFVADSDATLAARDLAVLRGYAAFDFLRTYGGYPFRLKKNLSRLRRSCEMIEMTFPWSDAEIEAIVSETLRRNKGASAEFTIRLVITGGVSPDNITPNGRPSLMVIVQPLVPLPQEWYSEGIKIITTEINRLFPEAKSTMYTPAILAQKRAREAGAVEAVYLDSQRYILEGTTTNVFALYGNTLVTPDTTDGRILPGVTRMTVLELAQEHYSIAVRGLPYDEFITADEIFITAANKQIVPVVTVDEHRIGSGRPGEGTGYLMALFKALTLRRAAGEEV